MEHSSGETKCKEAKRETIRKQLKQIEVSLLGILESCDALNPSELLLQDSSSGSSDVFILPHLIDHRGDDDFLEVMEQASKDFRRNRAILVGRVHASIRELDQVAKKLGIEIQ